MDDELTIYGTRGILRIWAWRGWRFEDSRGRAEEWLSYQRSEVPGYVGMAGALNEFASAIIEGRQAIPSAQDVLPTQEIIEKFYRRTGKTK
jgi:predicted dehydrogenase